MKSLCFVLALILSAPAFADKPILLVTPKGVFLAEVTDGVPGAFAPANFDVIVQGFGGGGGPGSPPVGPPTPPVSDPTVKAITELAKAMLKNKEEATAVSAMIETLIAAGIKPDELKEAVKAYYGIVDQAINAEGRVIAFLDKLMELTVDPAKIKAGLSVAWAVEGSEVNRLREAARAEELYELGAAGVSALMVALQAIFRLLQMIGGP